jgi:hypothetical protein
MRCKKAMSALPPIATAIAFRWPSRGAFWLFHFTPLPETGNGFQLAAAVITVCICSSDNANRVSPLPPPMQIAGSLPRSWKIRRPSSDQSGCSVRVGGLRFKLFFPAQDYIFSVRMCLWPPRRSPARSEKSFLAPPAKTFFVKTFFFKLLPPSVCGRCIGLRAEGLIERVAQRVSSPLAQRRAVCF